MPEEVDTASGALAPATLERIADQLERFRSLSFAVRRISAMKQLTTAVESIQGKILGVGSHFTMHVQLPSGADLSVSPVIGVPDSTYLHDAMVRVHGQPAARPEERCVGEECFRTCRKRWAPYN